MNPGPEASYPSRQTYVVKLRNDATPDALAGRLENTATDVRCEFTSARELFWLIAVDLMFKEGARDVEDSTSSPV